MTRSTRAALTVRQELQLVAADEIADFIDWDNDIDYELGYNVYDSFYDDDDFDGLREESFEDQYEYLY
jgi:hypothetical protein